MQHWSKILGGQGRQISSNKWNIPNPPVKGYAFCYRVGAIFDGVYVGYCDGIGLLYGWVLFFKTVYFAR